jgi:hypothetical protein
MVALLGKAALVAPEAVRKLTLMEQTTLSFRVLLVVKVVLLLQTVIVLHQEVLVEAAVGVLVQLILLGGLGRLAAVIHPVWAASVFKVWQMVE